jgi:osmotically-inducible protein OsmY
VKDATAKTKEQLAIAGDKTREALQGDGAITASIKASMLKDPDLSVLKIDVDTRDGVVVLNGLARDEAARERAGKIAEATKGVREVRNHLTTKQG